MPNDLFWDKLKEGFRDCLDNIRSSGSFCATGTAVTAPNPVLQIRKGNESDDVIGLPLSERDAEAIIEASHPAPFGKGGKTIVNTDVRRTWELSSGDVKLDNPAWAGFIQELATKGSIELGVSTTGLEVQAQLYKLLLYDKGAMFEAHKDSEKAARMFGTLVAILPSLHEGGEVHLEHASEKRVLESAPNSKGGYTYMAWFSDVVHEVKPVTSGRRLVLTYNLIYTSSIDTSSADNYFSSGPSADETQKQLKGLLNSWVTKSEWMPEHLMYVLNHEYSHANLSFENLKGEDKKLVAHLHRSCEDTGFVLYLASLEKKVYGECDENEEDVVFEHYGYHPIEEELESYIALPLVVNSDGQEISNDFWINEGALVQEEALRDSAPNNEEWSGYIGNQGIQATHWYRRTVVVFLPKPYRFAFFLDGQEAAFNDKCLQSWLQERTCDPGVVESSSLREELGYICEAAANYLPDLDKHSLGSISSETMNLLVSSTLCLNDRNRFLDVFKVCNSDCKYLLATYKNVGIALIRWNLQELFATIKEQLSKPKDGYHHIKMCYNLHAGVRFQSDNPSEFSSALNTLIDSEIEEALTLCTFVNRQDGSILAEACRTYTLEDIKEKILPIVKKNARHLNMILAFLRGIHDAVAIISAKSFDSIFECLGPVMADHFKLIAPATKSLLWRRNYLMTYFTPPQGEPQAPDMSYVDDLNELLFCSNMMVVEGQIDQIISKLTAEALFSITDLYPTVFLPIARSAVEYIANAGSKPAEAKVSLYRALTCAILQLYVTRYVKARPVETNTWTMDTIGCGCGDCVELSQFLQDPQEQKSKLQIDEKRSHHLTDMINNSGTNCDYKVESTGSPYKVVLTKQRQRGDYDKALSAWKIRCDEAHQFLNSLDHSVLKEILGADYEHIVNLEADELKKQNIEHSINNETHGTLSEISEAGRQQNRDQESLDSPTFRKVPNGEVITTVK